jgi:hypothetical protein
VAADVDLDAQLLGAPADHPVGIVAPIRNVAGTIAAISIWPELYNVAGPRRRSAPGTMSWGPILENDTLLVPATLMPHDSP